MQTLRQALAQAQELHEAGDLAAVEQICLEILRLQPDQFDALHRLGLVCSQTGRSEQALAYLNRALALQPRNPFLLINLVRINTELGRQEVVDNLCNRLQKEQSGQITMLVEQGKSLIAQGRLEEAIRQFQDVLGFLPKHVPALQGLGAAQAMSGRLGEALATFREALHLEPHSALSHYNLGTALFNNKQPADAVPFLQEAVRLKPDYVEAHFHLGQCWLILGKLENWWDEYEWRFLLPNAEAPFSRRTPWDGTPLPNGTILLHAEQGLGDTMHFAHFAPLVKERVGRYLECQPALVKLLGRCEGFDWVFSQGVARPVVDAQASLQSLGRVFRTNVRTIPAKMPYLFVEDESVARWRAALGPTAKLKVGIGWQGNPRFPADGPRSIPLAYYEPLASVPGVQLYILQKGPGREQLPDFAAKFPVIDLASQTSDDFTDTAAIIKNLDLVITSDTALAHVAGGLNVPVWVALHHLPNWQWLLDEHVSPWYPSARLFRQIKAGDWTEVFARIRDQLAIASKQKENEAAQ